MSCQGQGCKRSPSLDPAIYSQMRANWTSHLNLRHIIIIQKQYLLILDITSLFDQLFRNSFIIYLPSFCERFDCLINIYLLYIKESTRIMTTWRCEYYEQIHNTTRPTYLLINPKIILCYSYVCLNCTLTADTLFLIVNQLYMSQCRILLKSRKK